VAVVCASCGREIAEDARFCNGCGAPLAAVVPRREVRKTVTAAAERLRLSRKALVERGLSAPLSTRARLHGRALCGLGRFEEAEPLAEQGRGLGYEDDPVTRSLWRQVAALVRAHRGDHAEAERLARYGVAFMQRPDWPGCAVRTRRGAGRRRTA
jgi:hypothetical protein